MDFLSVIHDETVHEGSDEYIHELDKAVVSNQICSLIISWRTIVIKNIQEFF